MQGLVLAGRYVLGPLRDGACAAQAGGVLEVENFLACLGKKEAILARKVILGLPNAGHFLRLIGDNAKKDPLSQDVVEAYFVGNDITDKSLPKRDNKPHGLPHHNHQVLLSRHKLPKKTETLLAINRCIVRWAEVSRVDDELVHIDNLCEIVYGNGRLALQICPRSEVMPREIRIGPLVSFGDIVTIHRGIICQAISSRQREILKQYTLDAIKHENARGER